MPVTNYYCAVEKTFRVTKCIHAQCRELGYRKDEHCGLTFDHASHWWNDGDHDSEDHWCPGGLPT